MSASSKLKGESDARKYEKARRLKDSIDKVRKDYLHKMEHGTPEQKQLGTAAYLIDFLAIRVGNEKKEDEADTVGCCSLRKQHIRLLPDNAITLDFLGKDSMRYNNTIAVNPLAYRNLQAFLESKNEETEIFDLINSAKLNDYLHQLMDELTAKVFRTFNASFTL